MAQSAGLCVWRRGAIGPEVLLVHPGGPFWARKDDGAWSIPKGEFDPSNEDGLAAARREFLEELGFAAPDSPVTPLGQTRLKSGKVVHAWALEGDFDVSSLAGATVEIEWPPRSGRRQLFPEVDRAEWFDLKRAAEKLNPAQVVFLDRLRDLL